MRQAEPLRNEELNTLTMEFAWAILEHLAGLVAGQQDSPRLINDEGGFRCLREDTFQSCGGMHRRRAISQSCGSLDLT